MTDEPIIGDPAPVGMTPWPWRISNEWEYDGQVYCSIRDSCYQGEVVGPSVRIGPAAPAITLTGVTAIMECTAEAVEAWESEPWSQS